MATRLQYMLKLIVPGIDPLSLPTLTPDQIDRFPPKVLSDFFKLGDQQDQGDIVLLTISNSTQPDSYFQHSTQWARFGEDAPFLRHAEIEVSCSNNNDGPIPYQHEIHDQSPSFTTTPETHSYFEKCVALYIFSIRQGFTDLQAYLSKRLTSSHYPVYEAEILALLTSLAAEKLMSDLHVTDPELSGFIGQRMHRFRNTLAAIGPILTTLRSCASPRGRLMSILPHLSDNIAEQAASTLAATIGYRTETEALLNAFIEEHHRPIDRPPNSVANFSDAPETNHASPRSRGSSAPASEHSTTGSELSMSESDNISITHNHVQAMGHYTSPSPTRDLKRRRSRPTVADFDYSAKHCARTNHITLTRPAVNDEYWSVESDRWAEMNPLLKKIRTQAGLMCETQIGETIADPCDLCGKSDHTCDVYIKGDRRTAEATRKCAGCMIKKRPCSLAKASK